MLYSDGNVSDSNFHIDEWSIPYAAEPHWAPLDLNKASYQTVSVREATMSLSMDSSSNSNLNPVPLYLKILAIAFYSLSMLLGVGGNLLVLLVVIYYQRMRTVTNFFIFNLAISYLIFALLCIPITLVTAYIIQYWPFSAFLCVFFNYMQNVSVTLTVYTLVWITFDKYWAVVKPLKFRMSIKMCKALIMATWMFSFVISLPIAIYTKLEDGEGGDNISVVAGKIAIDGPQCSENWPKDLNYSHIYNIALICIQYVIPGVILSFSYIKIGFVLNKSKAPGEIILRRDAKMVQSKRRLLQMSFLLVLTFMITWTPLQILNIYRSYDSELNSSRHLAQLFFVCHLLAVSSSYLNVFIYSWANVHFRNGVKYLMCLKRSTNRRLKHSYTDQEIRQLNQNNTSCPQANQMRRYTAEIPDPLNKSNRPSSSNLYMELVFNKNLILYKMSRKY